MDKTHSRTIIVATNRRSFVFVNQPSGEMFMKKTLVGLVLMGDERIIQISSIPDTAGPRETWSTR